MGNCMCGQVSGGAAAVTIASAREELEQIMQDNEIFKADEVRKGQLVFNVTLFKVKLRAVANPKSNRFLEYRFGDNKYIFRTETTDNSTNCAFSLKNQFQLFISFDEI